MSQMNETRLILQLAKRLNAAKPAADEGPLALAAWQRCVNAIDENGMIHPDDVAVFHIVAGSQKEDM